MNAMLPIEGTDIKTAAATTARALTPTAVHNAQGDQVIALLAVETEEGYYGSQLAYYRSKLAFWRLCVMHREDWHGWAVRHAASMR